MKISHRELMTKARAALQGKWGIAAGITLVYCIVVILAGTPKYLKIASLIISGPLAVGYYMVMLSIARHHEVQFSMLFDGFRRFLTAFAACLLMMIFIILQLLLLIVPGIMAALSYSMTYFIIIDNPGIKASEALRKSKQLMYGNRWDYSCLMLRFTGWILLGIVTCGIGFFWIGPYLMTTCALYYDELLEADNNKARMSV
jgi:uncharacterized membrane protein